MKKKGSNPILKFTIIIILIAVAGFLIFYTIDNPGFWKNKFSSIFSGGESGETITSLEDTGEEQSENTTRESVTMEELGEDGTGDSAVAGVEYEEGSEDSSSSPSIWQKIIDFFRRNENNEAVEESYSGKLELNFYFSSLEEEKKLVSEKRTIIAGNSETAVRNAVTELLKGPEKSYHFPVIPAGTELIDAETNKNIAEIDLSQEFLNESLDSRILDEYIIYSIVNTLTEIPEIEGVIFYIEGIRIKVYGNIDLSIPAIRNKEYLEEQ